jgi:phosphotransacetylase
VSAPASSMRPVVVKTLNDIAADPALVRSLTISTIADLAKQAARVASDLQTELLARIAEGATGAQETDQVVLVEEAARMLATSVDTLHTKWRKLPFAFKCPLDGRIKFVAAGIERYLAGRTTR